MASLASDRDRRRRCAGDGAALRSRLGYLPAELAVDPHRTGHALLGSEARLRRTERRPVAHTVAHGRALAERLGLDLDRRSGALSTGNRRKLGIVLALAHDPRLVVLDEPTSGLDPLVQQEFATLVEESVAGGGSVVLCSHVLPEVQRLASQVAVLRRGRLVHAGSLASLRAQARREVTVDLADPADAARVAATLTDPVVTGDVVRGTLAGAPTALLAALAGISVVSLLITEPDLEQAFLHLYAEEQG